MDVDVNVLVSKLGDQIKQQSLNIAIKDVQIDNLNERIAELEVQLSKQ